MKAIVGTLPPPPQPPQQQGGQQQGGQQQGNQQQGGVQPSAPGIGFKTDNQPPPYNSI
jgi:hypothetical protein